MRRINAYLKGYFHGFANWANYREDDVTRLVDLKVEEAWKQDWDNIAKDWENVGNDLRKAMSKVEHPKPNP